MLSCISEPERLGSSFVMTEPLKGEDFSARTNDSSLFNSVAQRRAITRTNLVIVPRRAIRPKATNQESCLVSPIDAPLNAGSCLSPSTQLSLEVSSTAPASTASLVSSINANSTRLPSPVAKVVSPTDISASVNYVSATTKKSAGLPSKHVRKGTILLDAPPGIHPSRKPSSLNGSESLGSIVPSTGTRSPAVFIASDNSPANALHRERLRQSLSENQAFSSSHVDERECVEEDAEESHSFIQFPAHTSPSAQQQPATRVVSTAKKGAIQFDYDEFDDLDDDHPSAPFLSAPPRNMRLELGAFGELWSLVAEWVTFDR